MKSKRLARLLIILILLLGPSGGGQSALASSNSAIQTDAMVVNRNLDIWDATYIGFVSFTVRQVTQTQPSSTTPISSATHLPSATSTSTTVAPATPTFTSTPVTLSFTPVPATGTITGQVLAGKLVTVSLYDGSNTLITTVNASLDGMFSIAVPPDTYTVVANTEGFLRAQGSVTLTAGNTGTKPAITLPAGDIDSNDVIDQFDALTIGMKYNTAMPSAADSNNDGIINVLDLELLAKNYRKVGPVAW